MGLDILPGREGGGDYNYFHLYSCILCFYTNAFWPIHSHTFTHTESRAFLTNNALLLLFSKDPLCSGLSIHDHQLRTKPWSKYVWTYLQLSDIELMFYSDDRKIFQRRIYIFGHLQSHEKDWDTVCSYFQTTLGGLAMVEKIVLVKNWTKSYCDLENWCCWWYRSVSSAMTIGQDKGQAGKENEKRFSKLWRKLISINCCSPSPSQG